MLIAALLALGGGNAGLGALECPPLPSGEDRAVGELLSPGRVVLLGEVHGTVEAPAAVGALACRVVDAGLPVTVALELPGSESPGIDAFLESEGGPEARAELLRGDFWRHTQQDGRSSAAMADLLDELRRLRAAGTLRVTLFDRQPAGGSRDLAMAERLAASIGEGDDVVTLVLTGNLHARIVPGVPWDAGFEPMGLHLRRLRPDLDLVALDLTHAGGEAWVCQPEPKGCGAVRLRGTDGVEPGLELWPPDRGERYHGRLHLGPITASPPAAEGSP